MKINNNIPPIHFGGIRINAAENKEIKYLYNKVLDITRNEKIGGVFATNYITLSTEKSSVVEKLKEFGIKFLKGEK